MLEFVVMGAAVVLLTLATQGSRQKYAAVFISLTLLHFIFLLLA